jgi:flagellar FliJ protein
MNAMQPLLTLLEQTERERDDAMSVHQRAVAAHQAAVAQAEQLVAYRREYEQRWGDQFSRQGSIELVRCYQSFTTRLTQAVDHQQRSAVFAAQQVEAARETLMEHEVRVASVRKLIERRMQEAQLSSDRRDQKITDEFAARAAWNRASGLGAPRLA